MNDYSINPHSLKREGELAFKMGAKAGDCPYTFDKSIYWATRDTDAFQTIRWKLDAWMDGWLKAQKEARHGMNNGESSK